MAEPHAVAALKDKRAELSSIIADLEKRINQHRADLVHVDAVLRLFVPELEPETINAKRPAPVRSRYFADGELTRRCLEALRRAEGRAEGRPVAAEELAVAAMVDKGLDPADRKTRSDFIRRMLYALSSLRSKGMVEKLGHGLGARWRLPLEAPA